MNRNMNIRDDSALMQLEMSKKISNSESLRTAKASEDEYEDYNYKMSDYDYGGGGTTASRRQQQQPQVVLRANRRRHNGRLGALSGASPAVVVEGGGGGQQIERNFNIRGSLSSKHGGGGHKGGCDCKESRDSGVTMPPITIVRFIVSTQNTFNYTVQWTSLNVISNIGTSRLM